VSAGVAICIPTIPGRAAMLHQAVDSVLAQTVECVPIIVQDRHRLGAWATRNEALEIALCGQFGWVGFLDDDDYLLPHHVEHLLAVAREHQAQVVWSWFQVEGGSDPFPQHRGRQYDPADPHIFPITYLARREPLSVAVLAGGFRADEGHGTWETQDWPVVDSLWRSTDGAFYGSDEVTWVWRHHAANTSGMPNR
jgi:glycosyltransferase involved in cell wall biosynthesis